MIADRDKKYMMQNTDIERLTLYEVCDTILSTFRVLTDKSYEDSVIKKDKNGFSPGR